MTEREIYDALQARLVKHHPDLPPQLQLISQFVLDNPSQVALMTIADLSEQVGVQPSSVIRFSKAVGFNGFSEIQRILKNAMHAGGPQGYFDRLSQSAGTDSALQRFASLGAASLENLPNEKDFDRAVDYLVSARLIHVVGLRRAFGVACFLNYTLSGFDAPVQILSSLGQLDTANSATFHENDPLIAISFPDYIDQTIRTVELAKNAGAKVIAITDSTVSPIGLLSDVNLFTDQATDAGFRSSVGSMVTAQALAVAFGQKKNS